MVDFREKVSSFSKIRNLFQKFAKFDEIQTSMGGLCSEGHAFLKICRQRNPDRADLLLDVLVTQHSRWTARRIHRALTTEFFERSPPR